DVDSTKSLAAQAVSKRQSDHTAYTVPSASIPTEGNTISRRPPFGKRCWTSETSTESFHDTPPSVEVKERIWNANAFGVPSPRTGTTTVPSGWTTGWPPNPFTASAVAFLPLQLRPPSVDVDMYTRSNWAKLSNSV